MGVPLDLWDYSIPYFRGASVVSGTKYLVLAVKGSTFYFSEFYIDV